MNIDELREFFRRVRERDRRLREQMLRHADGYRGIDRTCDLLILLLIALTFCTCVASCATGRQVEQTVRRDTVYITRWQRQADSLAVSDVLTVRPRIITVRDTQIVSVDSIRTVTRWRNIYSLVHDTAYIARERADTVLAVNYKAAAEKADTGRRIAPWQGYALCLLSGLAAGIISVPIYRLIKR